MLTLEEMVQALTEYAAALSPGSRAAREVIEARNHFKRGKRIIEGAHVAHHQGDASVCANCGHRIIKVGKVYLHDPVTWGHIVQKIPGANDGRRCYAEGKDVASIIKAAEERKFNLVAVDDIPEVAE